MSNITTDLDSFENIDYPKNIYELLLHLKNQPIEINCNSTSNGENPIDLSSFLTINSFIEQNSYSLQEKLTGGTWINGEPIYRKVHELTQSEIDFCMNTGDVQINHNLGMNHLLSYRILLDPYFYNNDSISPQQHKGGNNTPDQTTFYMVNGGVPKYVIFEYTKLSDL